MSTATLPEMEQEIKYFPMYNVILLNDDDHSFQYVVKMLMKLFQHGPNKAADLTKEVHETGRAIVKTTTKEHAELKQEQVHAFGKDPIIPRCQGSMTCVLEPAI